MLFYKFTSILYLGLILFYCANLVYSNYVAHFEVPLHHKQVKKLKLAIIGAGAGGSSASYWLKEAFTNSSLNVNTTIYEQSSIVGGRAKIIKFIYNGEEIKIELGASLFIDVNYNMFNFSKKFGLEFVEIDEEIPGARIGVWTGENFVFESSSNYYWNLIKIVWRYGFAPLNVRNLVKETVNKFLKVYEFENPFTSVESATKRLNLHSLQEITGHYYFSEIQKINKNYIHDIMEPIVRVNYGQNISDIHAVGTCISLVAQGAKGIKGGNFLLFEKFIENSGANLQLNSKVIKIKKLPEKSLINTINDSRYLIYTEDGISEEYDGIILATPIEFSGITFENINIQKIQKIPYITLHVTLVIGNLNPSYFGKKLFDELPSHILTTNSAKVDFLILATKRKLDNGETIYKIFSRNYLSDEVLDKIYLNKSWIYRKVWKSYPKLLPNQTFPPLEIDDNFFYVNSFEPFISTMETEAVSSKNIVNIIAKRFNSVSLF